MEEQGQSITVVPMQPCHIEELERLEKECFSTPWSFDALVSELSNPLAVFRVAEIGGRVYDPLFAEAKSYYGYFGVGYGSYGLYPERRVAV